MSTEELQTQHYEGSLLVQPDEALPPLQSLLLGLQHLLAMDIYVVPFIIAGILSLSIQDSAFLIQATFIASGLGTLIQSRFLMKLPVAQGPSYVPIGAIAGIALAYGYRQSGSRLRRDSCRQPCRLHTRSHRHCAQSHQLFRTAACRRYDHLRRRALPHSHRPER